MGGAGEGGPPPSRGIRGRGGFGGGERHHPGPLPRGEGILFGGMGAGGGVGWVLADDLEGIALVVVFAF